MTQGVIYQLSGRPCAELMAVSLWSLRQHYGGPVTIMATRDCRQVASRIGADLHADVMTFELLRMTSPHRRRAHSQSKVLAYLGSPYEASVFLDTDTIVNAPIDELLSLSYRGIVATRLCEDRLMDTTPTAISAWHEVRQFRAFGRYGRHMVREASDANMHVVNTGVFGWPRGIDIIRELHHLVVMGREWRCSDESVVNLTLHRAPLQALMDPTWNASIWQYPDWSSHNITHLNAGAWWNCDAGRMCFSGAIASAISENAGGLASWCGSHNRRVLDLL